MSPQVLREYLVVARRPHTANGLGLTPEEALSNLPSFRERTALRAEDARAADRLVALLAEVPCRGQQNHDANLVATMLVHGVVGLVTENLDNFQCFGRHVTVVPLSGAWDGQPAATYAMAPLPAAHREVLRRRALDAHQDSSSTRCHRGGRWHVVSAPRAAPHVPT